MSRYYDFFCPVKLMAGEQALEQLAGELAGLGARKPLLLTDKGVSGTGLATLLAGVLAEGELPVAAIWDEIPADSSTAVVERIAARYRELGCDSLVALGGGSVIDTAKAVNILASMGGTRLLDYAGAGCLTRPLQPLAVVPTTAGTGSEVTLVAVIKDEASGRKVPFTSPFLLPQLAVLDPRLTQGLPLNITAATAMDAMTHAIEAFIGNAKNPVSDALALMAVEKIANALPQVLSNPQDKRLRLQLAEGSTLAGMAFSNSMVGLVHALGHSLGARCHLPHGLCMNLFLPTVLDYNRPGIDPELARLLLPLVGAERFAATPAAARPQAAIEALQALRDTLWQAVKLPRTLREAGVTDKALLPEIRDLAINDGALLYNRKDADRTQLLGLLELAWE
ncbi:iron-containing alcohol dehydrogenase [Aeromonas hydrophila]|uniref:NAD-dependent methanol dehydrogenase n=1 Tax=Aeromonas hydrophila subsp. hydrophila (strain ATCC 7966 / DSM 30187 / BCRC 13018 / CCUG 14551 / JCM 1027 / KCTC 2358 / NCIMB 9240 / NCTC 8049) TaxID=380703 RepID=A0KIE3_AERHH|nr:iron-containing alcohol dehydrogenase [Aeromonas hydrophila]ABK36659.1 NAD-dependent methanol dehydrogenase [Aeromonas hydrophila subsp. hydrophila ATCC 7966]MBS4670717.1 iron-containing alcohol dehydrogenase [Aeromonas hydrophila]OOD31700.1 alcohol dehydrogenase EutG [Aeromonas hydrophila]SUU24503.1 NAD-dependent methanol dehydrogenase [Aeromonas hydrophila]